MFDQDQRDQVAAGYISSLLPGAGVLPDIDFYALSESARGSASLRIASGEWSTWARIAARVGWCSNPIRLCGSSKTVDTSTSEVVDRYSSDDLLGGELKVPCGNRRADKCPACSRLYARDTFELIRTGLLGGKTVPEAVSDNPLVFATMTAPSFGRVHGVRKNGDPRCLPRKTEKECPHGRSVNCFEVHHRERR